MYIYIMPQARTHVPEIVLSCCVYVPEEKELYDGKRPFSDRTIKILFDIMMHYKFNNLCYIKICVQK